MGAPGAPSEPAGLAPMPASPVVDSFSAPPPARQPRPVSGSRRTPRARPRPRPAGGSRSTRMVARIAAPVVFLIAIIALIGIVAQSGVMSSDTPTPTVNATKTKEGAPSTATKKYVVQSGDSLSSIAQRFGSTTSEILALNPDLSGSTVVVGQRLVVPRQ